MGAGLVAGVEDPEVVGEQVDGATATTGHIELIGHRDRRLVDHRWIGDRQLDLARRLEQPDRVLHRVGDRHDAGSRWIDRDDAARDVDSGRRARVEHCLHEVDIGSVVVVAKRGNDIDRYGRVAEHHRAQMSWVPGWTATGVMGRILIEIGHRYVAVVVAVADHHLEVGRRLACRRPTLRSARCR